MQNIIHFSLEEHFLKSILLIKGCADSNEEEEKVKDEDVKDEEVKDEDEEEKYENEEWK